MTPWLLALVTGVTLIVPHGTKGSFALPVPAPPAPAPAQGSGAAPPPAASTPAQILSEVMVLHATNDNSGIDPRLGKMTALSKPPFSSYNSYKLLSHSAQPLARGLSSSLNLPTGRQLQLVYKDVILPHRPGMATRYLIAASIQSPSGKSLLPLVEVKAKPGEWFWVGGQEFRGGALFIGIKIP